MKHLFLVNRYGPFIDTVLCLASMFWIDQPNTCSLIWIVTFTWYIIGGWISEIILVMRTVALWNHHRVVVAILVSTILLMVVPCLSRAKLYAESIVYPPHEVLEVTRCVPSISDQSGWVFYAGVLFSETVIIILTLLRHFQTSVEGYNLPLLVYTMYRDGTIFYIVLLSLSVANFCCMWLAPVRTHSFRS
ncbi:hypothetical protein C8Q80DRAFT_1197294 [Daedaleopsis nitida]|nr:hypothetical protein C8Q80DRAFT_1197294 [Daedaleopsis nitida]